MRQSQSNTNNQRSRSLTRGRSGSNDFPLYAEMVKRNKKTITLPPTSTTLQNTSTHNQQHLSNNKLPWEKMVAVMLEGYDNIMSASNEREQRIAALRFMSASSSQSN